MVLSGIALAGANREAATPGGEDGMLYGIEAQASNLDGTELVVLSACETGQGDVDYSEGVYGLVRALRIAGARKVLMTLWPVNDGEAQAFMAEFYRSWLAQAGAAIPPRPCAPPSSPTPPAPIPPATTPDAGPPTTSSAGEAR